MLQLRSVPYTLRRLRPTLLAVCGYSVNLFSLNVESEIKQLLALLSAPIERNELADIVSAGFRGGPGGPGPQASHQQGPPTKPLNFFG